jgi:hypothetical protein
MKKPSKDMDCQRGECAISKTLVKEVDWTEKGADTLLMLVNDYGAFMLRNAIMLRFLSSGNPLKDELCLFTWGA